MAPSLSKVSVQRKPPVLLPPSSLTPSPLLPLSDIDDQQSLRFHVPFIQYYPHNPSTTNLDPVAVIKEAVSKALVFYYPFAGRLREVGPEGKLAVECTGEGVLFVEGEASLRLEELGEGFPPPEAGLLAEFLAEVPGSEGIVGCPLLLFQVTRLACGGFVVAVRLNHTTADAQGFSQFLHAVGELARGARSPTIAPSWSRDLLRARDPPRITHVHREFEPIPDPDRIQFPPDAKLVHRSFFFGPEQISALKSHVPFTCTSFEVVAACTWRARAVALGLDPNDELRFMFNINVRSKMNPPLPKGYYGNVFVYPAIVTTAERLCNCPLSYAVDLVQKAKAKATDGYIKSTADLMATKGRPPFAMNGAPRVYFVSDNTRAGFADVDYGWGPAVYGGPAAGGFGALPGVLSFYLAFKNREGEKGTVVPMCLPEGVMERFGHEIEKLVKAKTSEEESDVSCDAENGFWSLASSKGSIVQETMGVCDANVGV